MAAMIGHLVTLELRVMAGNEPRDVAFRLDARDALRDAAPETLRGASTRVTGLIWDQFSVALLVEEGLIEAHAYLPFGGHSLPAG